MTYLRAAFSVCSAAGVAAHSPDSSAGFWAWPWSLQSKPHTPCQNPQPPSPHSVTQTSHHIHINFYTCATPQKQALPQGTCSFTPTWSHYKKSKDIRSWCITWSVSGKIPSIGIRWYYCHHIKPTIVSLGHVYVKHMFWSKHTVRTPVT